MAALVLIVTLAVAAFHWLMEPLLQLLSVGFELTALAWLLVAAGLWLLSGRPEQR